jgi:hypothetical protein
MNTRLFYQNTRQLGINSENSYDNRLVLEDTPLIMRQKQQEAACIRLKDMPKGVIEVIRVKSSLVARRAMCLIYQDIYSDKMYYTYYHQL